MQFSSYHIKGKGRGKGIGFPTINLQIPEDFELKDGVYAVIVGIDEKSFKGAMHYGPIPVFNETEKSLEVYLLNIDSNNFPAIENKKINITVIKYIREIRSFPDSIELAKQIEKDVAEINQLISIE